MRKYSDIIPKCPFPAQKGDTVCPLLRIVRQIQLNCLKELLCYHEQSGHSFRFVNDYIHIHSAYNSLMKLNV